MKVSFKKKACALLLFVVLFTLGKPIVAHGQTKDTLTVMFYNLLNFPTATSTPNRQDTLRKILGYVKPDIFIACEINNSTGANLVLNNSLNVWGTTNYSMSSFVLNQSTSDNLQQMCYYNSDVLSLKSQSEILTDLRDVNEYILYYKDPNLPITSDTTWIDMYASHLKAGNGLTDSTRRDLEATAMRDYINTKPAGRNNIFGADFNVYTSAEPCYQTLTATGTYPFFDPINQPGAWNNNAAFAPIHTQSTRTASFNGGATGGLDDRFDLLLVSANVLSGANRARYIPGTYKPLGNDGLHFNLALLDPPAITLIPDSVRNALYYMSDHLPVVMQIEITLPLIFAKGIEMFAAERIGDRVDVSWIVNAETPSWMQVERSSDGVEFSPVSPKISAEDGIWMDMTPNEETNYYRLAMTSAEGKTAYSEVREVSIQHDFTLHFANPASHSLLFQFNSYQPISPILILTDLTGRRILTWEGERSNTGTGELDLCGISAGIYLMTLRDATTGKQCKPAKVMVQ